MSIYIKLSTLEYPRHEGDIRLEHPEIPEDKTGDDFPCPNTYAQVKRTDSPQLETPSEGQEISQAVSEGTPELRDGVWYQTWTIVNLSPETIQAWIDSKKNTHQIKEQDLTGSGSAPNVIG